MSDDARRRRDRDDRAMLEKLQAETFTYFDRHVHARTGLVADTSAPESVASIAAVGLALTSYAVAVERGLMPRVKAIARTLTALRFFAGSEQSAEPDATGHKGFYYHFLHMDTGRRAHRCELSTIDTALLIAGVLTSARYFDGTSTEETEIRALADLLYRRVDWTWASSTRGVIGHGWRPERGRIRYAWDSGYSEASILYVLALGSPTFPIPPNGYLEWISTFELKTIYGIEHLYAGPLFIHQLPQVWLDLRGIRDARCRALGFDYFENSRRATLMQREYCIDNPNGFAHYGENSWGLTASDGPGPAVRVVDGVRRRFYGYRARGAPFGPDDGTIAPWAVVSSLPFAPEIVCKTLHHAIERFALKKRDKTGFDASFNATFPETSRNPNGWVAPLKLGLNEGPIILMIDNHLHDFVWKLFRGCSYVQVGLERAGFQGGWLDETERKDG